MQPFMANAGPNLFAAQMQPSDARRAIAQQMQQSAMMPQQTDPNNPGEAVGQGASSVSRALIANYLMGNAVQRAGALA